MKTALTCILLFIMVFIPNVSSGSELDELKDVGISFGKGMPLYVFASPTCPHCKNFHENVTPVLIEKGFEVIYFMVAHDGSKSRKRAAEIYCSKEKTAQLNRFNAVLLPEVIVDGTDCLPMVDAMMDLAAMYGLVATPTVILPDDTAIKGIPDPDELSMAYLRAMSSLVNK